MSFMMLVVIAAVIVLNGLVTVSEGTVAVVSMFGKYRRVLRPGLNFIIPFVEKIFRRISIQNRSEELVFQAITSDQANVHFKAMLLYSVIDQEEETIKKVAYKFFSADNLMQALIRTVEGTVRGFVATKKQSEILLLRGEIVQEVKIHLDQSLEAWGYHLIDLQMNDIAFDQEIMQSMAKVVASSNLKAAAENEGQALLITKTKQAEAEGNAIKISADAERIAAQLRGQGMSLFREEVAKGMSRASQEMQAAGLDSNVILFSMWTDAIKHFAENGSGNMIILDGSTDGMTRTMRQMMAFGIKDSEKDTSH
ncbi:MAG: SPFH domain-containing protein [Proteobacteria bacterium]|nr:SPFH domain-containing protein [Pseudomonadota bacterium]